MTDGTTNPTNLDVALTGSDATVDMWTDNTLMTTVGSFIIVVLVSVL